jgi:hypothetical protein
MGSMNESGVVPEASRADRAQERRPGSSALIEAISADDAVLGADRSRWRGARIHSVFAHVINIDLGNNRLLTIAARDSDNAPDTIVAAVDDWTGCNIRVGHAVHFMGEKVFLGDGHCLSLADALPWSCRLPHYPVDATRLRENLALAHAHLESRGRGIGVAGTELAPAREAVRDDVERTLVGQFRDGRTGLCQAIETGDEPAVHRQIDRLVGLGPGLTPAGDDFLVGLLTVLNLPDSPGAAWRRIGTQVVASAVRRTNSISIAALRHAACGQVRDKLAGFCRALINERAEPMRAALDRVLEIGESSGSEIALGILSGFELHSRKA